jgi:hypothetical protein
MYKFLIKRLPGLIAGLMAVIMVFSVVPVSGAVVFAGDPLTETEDNGNTRLANELPVGETMHGTCEGTSWYDVDNFCFEITEAGRLQLEFLYPKPNSSGPAFTIFVYNADRKTIFDFELMDTDYDGAWTSRYAVLLSKGSYTISIRSDDDQTGWGMPYTLRVKCLPLYCEEEINGSIGTADELQLGKTIYGSGFTFNNFDEDYFAFDVKTTSKLSVNFTYAKTVADGRAYSFDIIRDDYEDGVLLYSFALSGSDGDGKWADRYAMYLKPGRYYARITTWSNWLTWGKEYTLSLGASPADAEQEVNSIHATASPMELSKPYSGSLLAANGKKDIDYYTFVLLKNTPVTVTFTHAILDGTDAFAKVSLWDSNGAKIGKDFQPRMNEAGTVAAFGEQKKGQYYITVDSVDNERAWGQQYTLMVTPGSADAAAANTAAENRLSLLKPKVSDIAYTGKAVVPRTVQVPNHSKKLVINKDYTVSACKNNRKIGLATATLKGKGLYTGTVEVKFRIVPGKTKVKRLTAGKGSLNISWSKVSTAQKVSGYKVYYRTKGATKWKSKTVSAKSSSLKIAKLKKGKRYEVKVRAYKKIKTGRSKGTYNAPYSTVKISAKVK